ncbi:MAG TPA: hypothetical protein VIL74_12115 [Pyrinomonadaceae bacterium]|jgi:hypothetical protein
MPENEPTRELLLKRRDEINDELSRAGESERLELDPDPEEQALEIEQAEVAVSREENLRRELADIEDRLLERAE